MMFKISALVFLVVVCQNANSLIVPEKFQEAYYTRYIVHTSDWASIGTLSTLKGYEGFPYVSVSSSADGRMGNSTGVPYFLFVDLDATGRDTTEDPRVTVSYTLADTLCIAEGLDPQDPRCGRVALLGEIEKVEDEEEHEFAKDALFSRHPDMEFWMTVHDFYIVKLVIQDIFLLNNYGGPKQIDLEDYYNAYLYTLFDPPQEN